VPGREVIHGDAVPWLHAWRPREDACFVTSLPDVSEVPSLGLAGWRAWFEDTAALVIDRTAPNAAAVFFQSDIRESGEWVDKGHLVHRAADRAGARCVFHRIVCRRPPGTSSFGRATYAHLLGFSKALVVDTAIARVDVVPDGGAVTWTKGMGRETCLDVCRWVRDAAHAKLVIDPFCGHGTVLAAANALGLEAIGVEQSARRVKKARALMH
jgi:DNA methylase